MRDRAMLSSANGLMECCIRAGATEIKSTELSEDEQENALIREWMCLNRALARLADANSYYQPPTAAEATARRESPALSFITSADSTVIDIPHSARIDSCCLDMDFELAESAPCAVAADYVLSGFEKSLHQQDILPVDACETHSAHDVHKFSHPHANRAVVLIALLVFVLLALMVYLDAQPVLLIRRMISRNVSAGAFI
mmetsp:Transcript_3607/g.10026  ORF Transcript_3607/g.10026 Transcript_3607/m.10026 type:complete len:199 (-) Transcript_3607:454-1050(-)